MEDSDDPRLGYLRRLSCSSSCFLSAEEAAALTTGLAALGGVRLVGLAGAATFFWEVADLDLGLGLALRMSEGRRMVVEWVMPLVSHPKPRTHELRDSGLTVV